MTCMRLVSFVGRVARTLAFDFGMWHAYDSRSGFHCDNRYGRVYFCECDHLVRVWLPMARLFHQNVNGTPRLINSYLLLTDSHRWARLCLYFHGVWFKMLPRGTSSSCWEFRWWRTS